MLNNKSILISLLLLAMLAFSVITNNSKLLNIYIVIAWILILMTMTLSIMIKWIVSNRYLLKDCQLDWTKKTLNQKRNPLYLFNWIATVGLLAYSGWIITAIVYAIAILIAKLLLSIAKDELKKEQA